METRLSSPVRQPENMVTTEASRALRAVGWLFVATGVLAIVEIIVRLFALQQFHFDFTIFNLLVGRWLLNHDSRGLQWAVIVSWIGAIAGTLMLIIVVLRAASPEMKVIGISIGDVSRPTVALFAIAIIALHAWQIWVLGRQETRALFRTSTLSRASSI